MGLVDYAGSDSDSEQEEETSPKVNAVTKKPVIAHGESFFDNEPAEKDFSKNLSLNKEDVLEDIVKPKDWELKMAEKAKRKLEKKAAKKAAKKEKKLAKKSKKDSKIAKVAGGGVQKKEKAKIVISALGSLSGIAEDSDDSDDDGNKVASNQKKLGSGFLSSLPAPKGRDNRSDGPASFAKSLVPPSVAKKTAAAPFVPKSVTVAPKTQEESDNDDDDEPTDFFGFSLAPSRREEPQSSEVPFMAMNSSMDVVGPSRPTEDDEMDPTQMYRDPEEEMEQGAPSASDQWLHRKISDEQAHKLLMRFSHDIGPEERRSINEMASSIVDVNVDAALGPDVRQNVIKNLGHRAFVEATSAPTPQVQTQGQMSRRKHQITYLASLAVAREEQLKDQWAEQKQSKRMARQKYGF